MKQTWNYTYSQGKLTSIQYPQGDASVPSLVQSYEVFCWREDADSSCRGGKASDRLQWRAKADNQLGYPYSERISYSYGPGGTPSLVKYSTMERGIETVWKSRKLEGNGARLPAFESLGTGVSGNDSARMTVTPRRAPS